MKSNLSAILIYFALFIVLILSLTPVYVLLKITFADPASFLNKGEFVFSLDNVENVFLSGNIYKPLRKSLIVAFGTATVSLLIAAPGAYVFAKIPGRTGYLFIILIFFTRMFPEVGVALPISINFIRLGLFDTNFGLILAHLIRVLPLVTWILIGTFKAIPKEVEEAGMMDGCSKFQVFRKIAVPIAAPGLVVAFIFGFLNSWDEFIYASYLCLLNKSLPLTVYYYVSRSGWFLSSTYSLVVTLPVLIFTYYFQRYLQVGQLAGALKG